MTGFFDQLTQRVEQSGSLLCVGLDPHPEGLPSYDPETVKAFCLRVIEATADYAAAYKPNSAFFECLGSEGWSVLKEVIAAVPREIPVILDAKRGDIGSTSRAYAIAAFEVLGARAVTLNPYLGLEALIPFFEYPDRGAFILCRTSNPGAGRVQGGLGMKTPLYLRIVEEVESWTGPGELGLVVGATVPEALAEIRQTTADRWILAPGVGAQEADLPRALGAGLREDGAGLLIPVSRGIAGAEDPRKAAQDLVDRINRNREGLAGQSSRRGLPRPLQELAIDLLEAGCVRFGEFTLKSGIQSPIYFDLRLLSGHPDLLDRVARSYLSRLKDLQFDRIAALPYAGLPIGTALSLQSGVPMVYGRKEVKEYGTGAAVEGGFQPGETVILVDDLATTGGSKFEAIETLEDAGLRVRDVVVLIDRESGAGPELRGSGYQLHSVFQLSELLDLWEREGKISRQQIRAVRKFLGTEGNN